MIVFVFIYHVFPRIVSSVTDFNRRNTFNEHSFGNNDFEKHLPFQNNAHREPNSEPGGVCSAYVLHSFRLYCTQPQLCDTATILFAAMRWDFTNYVRYIVLGVMTVQNFAFIDNRAKLANDELTFFSIICRVQFSSLGLIVTGFCDHFAYIVLGSWKIIDRFSW